MDKVVVIRRVNVMLGYGKTVHIGSQMTVNGKAYAAHRDCGGNRATERYSETTEAVTCKRCLKALAARNEVLDVAEAEAYEEQAQRDVAVQRSGRRSVSPVPLTAGRSDIQLLGRSVSHEEAAQRVADFGKTRAARALRALAGQVTEAVAEAVEDTSRDARQDVQTAGILPQQAWSGDLLWSSLNDGRTWTTLQGDVWTLTAHRGEDGLRGWYLTGPAVDGRVRVGTLLSASMARAEELMAWI